MILLKRLDTKVRGGIAARSPLGHPRCRRSFGKVYFAHDRTQARSQVAQLTSDIRADACANWHRASAIRAHSRPPALATESAETRIRMSTCRCCADTNLQTGSLWAAGNTRS